MDFIIRGNFAVQSQDILVTIDIFYEDPFWAVSSPAFSFTQGRYQVAAFSITAPSKHSQWPHAIKPCFTYHTKANISGEKKN